jgi:uncharacterized protein
VDHNPCIGCHTRCCRHYAIYVTSGEVHRIARRIGVRAADLVQLETVALSPSMPVARLAEGEGQLVLRSDGGDCGFLDGALCTIHDHVPMICRLYPFTVAGRDDQLRHRGDVMCPDPFVLDDEDRVALLRAARRFWQRDLPAYERRVWVWNLTRAGGDLGAFLEFCARQLVIDKQAIARARFGAFD